MPDAPSARSRPGPLTVYGPVAILAVAILLVGVLATVKGKSDDTISVATPTDPGRGGAEGSDPTDNPDLPVTFNDAAAAGTAADHDWGDCDLITGRVRLPSVYAPPCVPVFTGDNGGATSRGVTADTIKVVSYEAPPGGDLSAALSGLIDDIEVQRRTRDSYVELLSNVFETYGREIEVVTLIGSGGADDAAAAVADAIKIREEIKPFAVLGGPALTNAFADELAGDPGAGDGILCIGCGLSVPDSVFQKNAPYMWGNGPTPEQFLVNFGDYLAKRLLGRTADYAGGDIQGRPRVFGIINFDQDPPVFADVAREVTARGEQRGFEAAVRETYILDIPKLPERATAIVARMKAAGVTTIAFLGDPIMPIYLTQAATAEDYYPEWVIAGTVLTDTTTLGRQYDNSQWAHAFGVSNLAARLPQVEQEHWRLHEWYYGEPPEAVLSGGTIWPGIFALMLGIHMAGPNLSPETFQGGMFSYPPSGGGPTTPQISYGNHGFFPAPDYLGVDDVVEVWWDPDAEGPDEQGRSEAPGMWRYANGGSRIPPGRMPSGPSAPHDPDASPALFDAPPPQDQFPDYPPPEGSPAAGG